MTTIHWPEVPPSKPAKYAGDWNSLIVFGALLLVLVVPTAVLLAIVLL